MNPSEQADLDGASLSDNEPIPVKFIVDFSSILVDFCFLERELY